MRIIIIFAFVLSLLPVLAQAQAKRAQTRPAPSDASPAQEIARPTSDEVKRVLNYYLQGKGMGPVLIEAKICRDIIAAGKDENECGGDITTHVIKKGESWYLWMAFMVPSGEDTQNIVIMFEKGGVPRKVENLQVSSQLRNRSWIKVTWDTPGSWQLKIARDTGSSAEFLGTLDVTVN
jgi:hypothetical protein